jgi:signal transduction histidine kinase
MRNVRRRARASEIGILATRRGCSLRVSVEDDGEGFNLHDLTVGYPRRGLGLAGMQERAKAVGGEVEIDSQLGQGTHATLSVPLGHQRTSSQRMLAWGASRRGGEESLTE